MVVGYLADLDTICYDASHTAFHMCSGYINQNTYQDNKEKDMTKEQMINQLLSDDCDTVQQWVMQGCYEDLWAWMRQTKEYECWYAGEVEREWGDRFQQEAPPIELTVHDIEFMEDAK